MSSVDVLDARMQSAWVTRPRAGEDLPLQRQVFESRLDDDVHPIETVERGRRRDERPALRRMRRGNPALRHRRSHSSRRIDASPCSRAAAFTSFSSTGMPPLA